MVVSKSKYEEIRQQKVEQNKKRMEELNLKKLCQDLRTSSPKTSPVKQAKPRLPRSLTDLVPVRRSTRFADKPPVSYKEIGGEPLDFERTRRRPSGLYRRRDLDDRVYASDEIREAAIDKAEQLQSSLESGFPSFVKPMTQSHVTGGFWLGLPVHFCKAHLPKHDEFINLVDENGESSESKYLAQKTGLSAGWRGFAIDHDLVDGDALVFQLVNPREFKVYIIRAYESEDSEEQENEEVELNIDNDNEGKRNKEEKNELDKKKDIVVKPSDRGSKRIRAREVSEDNGKEERENKEDKKILEQSNRRSSKRIKAKELSEDNDKENKEENKDLEVKQLDRRTSKRIKETGKK